MRVSTKGRYALRIMVGLAAHYHDEGTVSIRTLAEEQELTVKYTEQIILLLGKAGFLTSTRGAGGGYRLARRPSTYSVGEILRATEGELCPCDEDEKNPGFWQGLHRTVNNFADRISLQDVYDENRGSSREPAVWIL